MITRILKKSSHIKRNFSFEILHKNMEKRIKFTRDLDKLNKKYQRRCKKKKISLFLVLRRDKQIIDYVRNHYIRTFFMSTFVFLAYKYEWAQCKSYF